MLDKANQLGRADVEMVMRLARNSGLRIHECLKMDKKMAEKFVDTGIITIKGKGGRVRDVQLREEARHVLETVARNVEKAVISCLFPGESGLILLKIQLRILSGNTGSRGKRI